MFRPASGHQQAYIEYLQNTSTVHTGNITGNAKRLFAKLPRPAVGPKKASYWDCRSSVMLHRVTSQKSDGLKYTAAEAWSHETFLFKGYRGAFLADKVA
jgi:hypothetical protein